MAFINNTIFRTFRISIDTGIAQTEISTLTVSQFVILIH